MRWRRRRKNRRGTVLCRVCKVNDVVPHCSPRNRCGWFLCRMCGTRYDPGRERWVRRGIWINEEGVSPSA